MNKAELKKYWGLRQELNTLDSQMSQINHDMSSLNAQQFSHVPRSQSKSPSDDRLVKLIMKLSDLQKRYNEKWDQVIDQMSEVENVIESLDDPIERVLMRHRYMEGLTCEETCERMVISWRQYHYCHNKALAKIEKCNRFALS